MRYLSVVNGCFVDFPGGAPRVAWDMCKAMVQRGHEVTMFCPKHRPEEPDDVIYEGIRVVRFILPKIHPLHPLKLNSYMKAAAKAINKYLHNISWDIVHVHLPLEGYAAYKAIGQGPEYIYTCHSPATMEMDYNWSKQGWKGTIKRVFGLKRLKSMEFELLSQSSRIHTLSNYTRQCLETLYKIGSKVTVIPHWCREDFSRSLTKLQAREKLGWPSNAQIIYSVRGLRERYGVDVAIKAIAPIVKESENTFYMLAGKGHLKEALMKLANELQVGSRIQFMGRISDQTLKLCYEAADVFILPTIALECFGLIVLEAFAYGLPVISTDAGAIPELMAPVLPDCIVAAGDVKSLEQKIQQFFGGQLKVPAAKEIQQYSQEHYSQNVVVPKIIRWIEQGQDIE